MVGDADFSDEWSKGKSSPFIQVTSPMGNLDPYLPALPTKQETNPNFWIIQHVYGIMKKFKSNNWYLL